MLRTEIGPLDEILDAHAGLLGSDSTAYRNHTYRVANLALELGPSSVEQIEKVAIATAFHDLGIWTDGTFDYLQPSARLAEGYLARMHREDWVPEIREMILEHHKISRYRSEPHSLVESFRQADWIDVSRGALTFGLQRSFLWEVFATWPDAGFHKLLARLSLKRLCTHPWSPLPMLRF
jgi:hypothetical protein